MFNFDSILGHTCLAISLVFSVGCGGSFKSKSGSDQPSLEPEFNVLKGQLLNEKGNPISNAKILLQLPEFEKRALSDKFGVYEIAISTIEYKKLPDFFSLYATHAGKAPIGIDFSKSHPGTDVKGEKFEVQIEEMKDLKGAHEDIVPMVSRVIHLGDSVFGGSENSQFQFPEAEGVQVSLTINLSEQKILDYSEFELRIKARGIQTSNLVVITPSGSAQASSMIPLRSTPTNGSSSEQILTVPLDSLGSGENEIRIESVSRGSGSGDLDDFEIVTAQAVFKKRADICYIDYDQEKGPLQKAQRQCLSHHAPIQRSVACMAADVVDNKRVSTFDYPEKWPFYVNTIDFIPTSFSFFDSYKIGFPNCYILYGLNSPTGSTPISLKSNSQINVNRDCIFNVDSLKVSTVTGYTSVHQMARELQNQVLSKESVTPFQFYRDAMAITGNDSVQALSLMGLLTHRFSRSSLLREYFIHFYFKDYVPSDRFENIEKSLRSSNDSRRQEGYSYLQTLVDEGSGLEQENLDKFRDNFEKIFALEKKIKSGTTQFSEEDKHYMIYVDRKINPVLSNLVTTYTNIRTGLNGQFYHWYTYFNVNYTYYTDPLTSGTVNSLAWLYETIQQDEADKESDRQARVAGQRMGCYVKFMEQNSDINWSQHFQCDQVLTESDYLNAKIIRFPQDRIPSSLSETLNFGPGCARALRNPEVW